VLITGDGRRPGIKKFSDRVRAWVASQGRRVRVELDPEKDLSRARADCVVILGGDGSILSAAGRMGRNQIPCVGIQIGRFGFLSELTRGEWREKLLKILEGKGRVAERMMLSCRVHRGRKVVWRGLALNEAVVASGSAARMVMIELEVDGEYLSSFHGDGVIIATPVGSTAHSLSAGGPIVEPKLRAFIITPVCSHTLTIRPLVVSSGRKLRLRPRESRNSLFLAVDGKRVHKLEREEDVRVEEAPVSLKLIRIQGRSFFETLRNKFHWGGTLLSEAP